MKWPETVEVKQPSSDGSTSRSDSLAPQLHAQHCWQLLLRLQVIRSYIERLLMFNFFQQSRQPCSTNAALQLWEEPSFNSLLPSLIVPEVLDTNSITLKLIFPPCFPGRSTWAWGSQPFTLIPVDLKFKRFSQWWNSTMLQSKAQLKKEKNSIIIKSITNLLNLNQSLNRHVDFLFV